MWFLSETKIKEANNFHIKERLYLIGAHVVSSPVNSDRHFGFYIYMNLDSFNWTNVLGTHEPSEYFIFIIIFNLLGLKTADWNGGQIKWPQLLPNFHKLVSAESCVSSIIESLFWTYYSKPWPKSLKFCFLNHNVSPCSDPRDSVVPNVEQVFPRQ